MGVRVKGLNKLKKMERDVKKLSKPQSIQITELFTDSFLAKNTKFNNFVEFEQSEIFTKYKTIEEIPDVEMDEFIKRNSKFDSWEDILGTATEEYIAKKLGF